MHLSDYFVINNMSVIPMLLLFVLLSYILINYIVIMIFGRCFWRKKFQMIKVIQLCHFSSEEINHFLIFFHSKIIRQTLDLETQKILRYLVSSFLNDKLVHLPFIYKLLLYINKKCVFLFALINWLRGNVGHNECMNEDHIWMR